MILSKCRKVYKTLFKGLHLLWNASPKRLIIIILLSIGIGANASLSVIIWKMLIDQLAVAFSAYTWSWEVVVYIVGVSGIALFGRVANYAVLNVRSNFSDSLDIYITNHILNRAILFSMETYDHPIVYNQLNIAITKTAQQCLTICSTLVSGVSSLIQIISLTAVIAPYNMWVIILCFLSALPLVFTAVDSNKYWYELFVQRTEKLRLVNYLKLLMTKNENIKEIKLYSMGKKIVDLIHQVYTEYLENDREVRRKYVKKNGAASAIDEIVSTFLKVWIVFTSLLQHASLGTVVMYLNSQSSIKTAIQTLLGEVSNIHNSTLYLDALDAIENVQLPQSQSKMKFDYNFSEIRFDHVSFKYPGTDKYIIHDLTFSLKKGKTYSLVGFNGSGKTTMIKLLLKLYKPTEGTIWVDDIDLQSIDTESYCEKISAVFQDFNVFRQIFFLVVCDKPFYCAYAVIVVEFPVIPDKNHRVDIRDVFKQSVSEIFKLDIMIDTHVRLERIVPFFGVSYLNSPRREMVV